MKRQASKPSGFERSRILQEFIDDLAASGFSVRTEDFYQDHLVIPLSRYLDRAGIDLLGDITAETMRAYLRESRRTNVQGAKVERLLSPTTVGHRYQAAKRFFDWCVTEGFIDASPMATLRRPKQPKVTIEAFTPEEAKRLVLYAGKAPGILAYRDKALVLTLLGCGLRAGELLGMRWPDIDWANRRITVTGKTGQRRVPLGPKTRAALRAWQGRCPQIRGEPVWVTLRKTPMRQGALWMMIHNLGEYAGVPKCHPHRFRHTAATEYAAAHRDPFAAKALLGHTQLRTTERYLQALGADYALQKGYSTPDEWLG